MGKNTRVQLWIGKAEINRQTCIWGYKDDVEKNWPGRGKRGGRRKWNKSERERAEGKKLGADERKESRELPNPTSFRQAWRPSLEPWA